ncbi:MAG TPA: polysaccharide biosynthesis protein [Peptococcaceae bacterium]|nr:polysaccharide biosynthesis protein [Peptococcaceae bacterium]
MAKAAFNFFVLDNSLFRYIEPLCLVTFNDGRMDKQGVTMKAQSFLSGAFVLAAAGIVVKLLGAAYRIPFTRIVGSEGIGIYQMAYPIYTTLLALSTAGIPVALSYLIAESRAVGDQRRARQVFFVSLCFLLILGSIMAVGLYYISPFLAQRVLGDPRVYHSLIAVTPAVFVISIVSAFRGYFQGWQLMWPTAFSEVVEQVVRIITVLMAAYLLMPRGVEYAAAGAASGTFTGGCAALLLLVLVFIWFEKREMSGTAGRWRLGIRFTDVLRIIKRLFTYAVPISAGSLVLPLVQVIDTVIIPNRLQDIGFTIEQATSLYGQLSGMAGTVVYLPAAVTTSIAMSLVPHLSAAISRNDLREVHQKINTSLRITNMLCLPASAGIMVLATPIMELLFDDPSAGIITAWLAAAALFTGLQQTTAGALQGIGKTWVPVINLIAGCSVKILCNYYLTVIPGFGIKGAALGSVLGFFLVFLLNLISLSKLTGYRLRVGSLLIRPLLAVTIMVMAVLVIYAILIPMGNLIATGVSIIGGAVCYFAVLLITKEIKAYNLRFSIKR